MMKTNKCIFKLQPSKHTHFEQKATIREFQGHCLEKKKLNKSILIPSVIFSHPGNFTNRMIAMSTCSLFYGIYM